MYRYSLCLLLFAAILIAQTQSASPGRPARHYSYSGNDPAQWTSVVFASPEAAALADFTVFPCNSASCAVARVITDANRNTYVVGSRYFQGTSGSAQASDVFVAKLDPAGRRSS